jgi:tetratricopeptide (TPR) repeat protein
MNWLPRNKATGRSLARGVFLIFYAAVSIVGQTTTPPLLEARQLLKDGKLPPAEKLTRDYVAKNVTSPDGHYLLGEILFLEKNARESLAEFTEAAKYRTPTATELMIVASDYVVLADYPDADKWFSKVVTWEPQNVEAWYDLGRTRYNENHFKEAIETFQHTLQLDPKNVKAEDNLGLSYQGLGRNDEATAAYKIAIGWQKDAAKQDPGPYLDLGTLLVESGKPADGLPYLLQAASLNDNDPKVHNQLGKAYMHLKQLPKAQAELEKAVALAPDNPSEHFLLGQIFHKEGQEGKAKKEMARFKALNGTHSTDEGGGMR